MCFTNTDVPSVDGVDLAALFGQWGVETVMLPITYRLPQAAVGSWGISSTFWTSSITSPTTRLQTARSCWTDCLWLRGAIDGMGRGDRSKWRPHIPARRGSSTLLTLPSWSIPRGMARFLRRHGGPNRPSAEYCGGEILCGPSGRHPAALRPRARSLA